jgi:hypothetical protein
LSLSRGPQADAFGSDAGAGKAISTRRDRCDANGVNAEGFHPFFTKAGKLRPGLEFLTEKPQRLPPWAK